MTQLGLGLILTTRFLYLAIVPQPSSVFQGQVLGGGPSECQKAHRSARNGTEIQEFFYLKNRGLCAIGLSELLESSGKIQLIPGAPLSSVRFDWRKSGPPVDRRDRSAAGEMRASRETSREFLFFQISQPKLHHRAAKGHLAVRVCHWQKFFGCPRRRSGDSTRLVTTPRPGRRHSARRDASTRA